ncbi:MAG: hypothetical protein K5639_02855 [Eubacterium sp.]|nr:hypothetical protein [Eubacterium sp.]
MTFVIDDEVRDHFFDVEFGLEKEGLRVVEGGLFAKTSHPFAEDDEHIVRDFCENQTEINTGVHESVEGVMEELLSHTNRVKKVLANQTQKEYLWPFSSPPYIRGDDDIPVAKFDGHLSSKTAYRHYLAKKYGRYKMSFSGIHVNYSIGKELLKAAYDAYQTEMDSRLSLREYKDELYLKLAEGAVKYGWLLVTLTAASPLLDGSYLDEAELGKTVFDGMASVRCSEMGYWNDFIPVLDYSSVEGYAKSIEKYVEKGLLASPSELYYPIRLKSGGENDLNRLVDEGISHIELRMFDLNPLFEAGLNEKDVRFTGLFLNWIAATYNKITDEEENKKMQLTAVKNFKKAAHYDIFHETIELGKSAKKTIAEAGEDILRSMMEFYEGVNPENLEAIKVIEFELEKITDNSKRYSTVIKEKFSDGFVDKAMNDLTTRGGQYV